MKKIKNWWNKERVHRIEKDTSQDFCPTNGEAVVFALLMSFIPFFYNFNIVYNRKVTIKRNLTL